MINLVKLGDIIDDATAALIKHFHELVITATVGVLPSSLLGRRSVDIVLDIYAPPALAHSSELSYLQPGRLTPFQLAAQAQEAKLALIQSNAKAQAARADQASADKLTHREGPRTTELKVDSVSEDDLDMVEEAAEEAVVPKVELPEEAQPSAAGAAASAPAPAPVPKKQPIFKPKHLKQAAYLKREPFVKAPQVKAPPRPRAEDSDDDVPLALRIGGAGEVKAEVDSEDDVPLAVRAKKSLPTGSKAKLVKQEDGQPEQVAKKRKSKIKAEVMRDDTNETYQVVNGEFNFEVSCGRLAYF